MMTRVIALMIVLVVACRDDVVNRVLTPDEVGLVRPPLVHFSQADFVATEPPQCTGQQQARDALVHGAAFEIDRSVVSCADYALCVRAGACPDKRIDYEGTKVPPHSCELGQEVAFFEAAQAFCAWRGMKLPTAAEWQRAVRGTQGWKTPNGQPWKYPDDCKTEVPRRLLGVLGRCRFATAEGFEYALHSDHVEYARIDRCANGSKADRVVIYLVEDAMRLSDVDVPRATFRCVRDGENP